jgi:transposase
MLPVAAHYQNHRRHRLTKRRRKRVDCTPRYCPADAQEADELLAEQPGDGAGTHH